METGKYWLIVTHGCNLEGRAYSQHIDDRLPYLVKEGISPVVLSGPTGVPRTDVPHFQVYSPAPSGLRFELGKTLKTRTAGRPFFRAAGALLRFLALPFYLVEKAIVDVESQWSWFVPAAVRGYFLCGKYDPEIVYSTGGPFSAHIAACVIASMRRKTWIAELQDPLVHGDWRRSGRALKVHMLVEKLVCEKADAVVFVTEGAMRGAAARVGLGERARVVYPGAVPAAEPAGEYRKGESCRFAHFGSLAGSRNVDVFLDALDRLFRDRPDLPGFVRLDLCGTIDRHALSRVESFPFPGVVNVPGLLPRSGSLEAMRRSDVLLLIQNTSEFSSETIPSKTYEYMQTGRPILGLVHGNEELSAMLREQGHEAVAAADPDAVRGGILRCLDRWRESGSSAPAVPPSHYTVDAAVGRLVGISRELLGREAPRGRADG